jgi:hypothetical protein
MKNTVKESTLGPFQTNLEFESRLEGKKKEKKSQSKKTRPVKEYVKNGLAVRMKENQMHSESQWKPPENDIPETSRSPLKFLSQNLPETPQEQDSSPINSLVSVTKVHSVDTVIMNDDERES